MPIYEYECERCSCHFDLRRSFSDSGNEDASCPRCQGKTRRLFSPVPIIFKGSGFYVTDKAAAEVKPPDRRSTGAMAGGPDSQKDGDTVKETEKENKEAPSPLPAGKGELSKREGA